MNGRFEALAQVLGRLRAEVGDIEFGFRAQGLFAHVLSRIGAEVIEIRHQGHPDIVANMNGRTVRFEVEITSARDRHHVIKSDDLASIGGAHNAEDGFLAILDSAYPVRWAVIGSSRIGRRLGRWPLVTLHALADQSLSKQCGAAFGEILSENAENLPALTFHLLCDRVLRRDHF